MKLLLLAMVLLSACSMCRQPEAASGIPAMLKAPPVDEDLEEMRAPIEEACPCPRPWDETNHCCDRYSEEL